MSLDNGFGGVIQITTSPGSKNGASVVIFSVYFFLYGGDTRGISSPAGEAHLLWIEAASEKR